MQWIASGSWQVAAVNPIHDLLKPNLSEREPVRAPEQSFHTFSAIIKSIGSDILLKMVLLCFHTKS